MVDILKDFSIGALVRVIEANLWEFGIYLGQSPKVELINAVDMMWYATGLVHPMLNGVFRTRLAPSETDLKIKATLNYFRSRKLPIMWWIGPSTRPVGLEKHLEAHGFTHGEDMLGMAVDLLALKEELPLPSGLTIEHVGDVETLKAWALPFAVGFGFPHSTVSTFCNILASLGLGQQPPLQHYVARLNGQPVACSSLFLGAGVAGIYNIATVPDQRGQGIGMALTLGPLCKARNAGYRIGVLHSSPMGFNVYRRIGFKEYCKIRTYVSAPETNCG